MVHRTRPYPTIILARIAQFHNLKSIDIFKRYLRPSQRSDLARSGLIMADLCEKDTLNSDCDVFSPILNWFSLRQAAGQGAVGGGRHGGIPQIDALE